MAAPKEITIFPKTPDKAGFVRLHMFVSINNEPGWFPTKVKCLKDSWDQEKQKIKSEQIGYKKLNGILRNRKGQLQSVFDDLEYEKIFPTVDIVRERYNAILNHETGQEEVKKRDYKFLEFLDLYVKEREKIRAKGYLRQFKATRAHVAAVHPDPDFSDINMKFYTDLATHMLDECEVENNTVYGNVKRIKTIMGAALIDPRTKHQNIPLDFQLFDDLYVPPKVVWIDWETELAALEEFEPLPEDLPYLQFWLFMCYTGLRHSDAFKLGPEHFVKKRDQVYLDHTIVKTKLDHSIQLSSKAVEILKQWNYKVPRIHQHHLNAAIKNIACAAGKAWEKQRKDSPLMKMVEKVRYSGSERIITILPKYELISTHTARRSFGRRWAERDGDLRLLQLYFGHATLQQTIDYIGWSTMEVNKEMARVIG